MLIQVSSVSLLWIGWALLYFNWRYTDKVKNIYRTQQQMMVYLVEQWPEKSIRVEGRMGRRIYLKQSLSNNLYYFDTSLVVPEMLPSVSQTFAHKIASTASLKTDNASLSGCFFLCLCCSILVDLNNVLAKSKHL